MEIQLLLAVVFSIALLLILILWLKIQPFLALLTSSVAAGLIAGMPPMTVIESIRQGMSNTLGFVATVVGLGALFGAILEHSGGAQSLATYLLRKFGDKRAPHAMMITGFIVAIPVFFDVAFVILAPILYALQAKTGKSLLLFALPLLVGLAITHSFIPPTPGPVAVAEILGAPLGWVITFGFLAGVPTALIPGLWFSKKMASKLNIGIPSYIEHTETDKIDLPPFFLVLSIIGIPIVLIVISTVVSSPLADPWGISSGILDVMSFLGHPFTALTLANGLAWYFLGIKRKMRKDQLLEISSRSLGPAGIIILVTGAGGVFKQVLVDTGVGELLATSMASMGMPVLIFAFLAAATVRILQGSATVAMVTAAGLTAALLENGTGDMERALLVIAIASGATILSHVNDSGFWLVNRYLGLTEKQTFKTWSVLTTLIAGVGFSVSALIYWLFLV